MKITLISGSHRRQAQTLKVARHIQRALEDGGCEQTALVNLADNPLPLWDMGVWDGDEQWKQRLDPIRALDAHQGTTGLL